LIGDEELMICPFCLKEFDPRGYKVHIIFCATKTTVPSSKISSNNLITFSKALGVIGKLGKFLR